MEANHLVQDGFAGGLRVLGLALLAKSGLALGFGLLAAILIGAGQVFVYVELRLVTRLPRGVVVN